MGANDRQVGGSHYARSGLQHWDVVVHFELDYFAGQITRYLFRWKKKGGIEDLRKAQHYLEKYIELEEARHVELEEARPGGRKIEDGQGSPPAARGHVASPVTDRGLARGPGE